jgi:hypothetical protein
MISSSKASPPGPWDQGTAYGANLDYTLNLDLMRMGLIPGALIKFRAETLWQLGQRHRRTILPEYPRFVSRYWQTQSGSRLHDDGSQLHPVPFAEPGPVLSARSIRSMAI